MIATIIIVILSTFAIYTLLNKKMIISDSWFTPLCLSFLLSVLIGVIFILTLSSIATSSPSKIYSSNHLSSISAIEMKEGEPIINTTEYEGTDMYVVVCEDNSYIVPKDKSILAEGDTPTLYTYEVSFSNTLSSSIAQFFLGNLPIETYYKITTPPLLTN